MNRLGTLVAIARRFGWRDAMRVAALWAARQTLHYRSAVVFALDLARLPAIAGCDDVQWTYAPSSAIDAMLAPAPRPQAPDARTFFIGTLDGRECYSSVVAAQGFSVPERARVAFSSTEEAYVGDCITLPELRGRGLYPCGLVQLGARLRADGKMILYLFVERENLASIRAVVKTRFTPIASCSVWRIGSRVHRRWRFLSAAPEQARRWTIDPPA